jgi:hypothetical protein
MNHPATVTPIKPDLFSDSRSTRNTEPSGGFRKAMRYANGMRVRKTVQSKRRGVSLWANAMREGLSE